MSDNVHEGALYIDTERGVVSFLTKNGQRLLRVTHLSTPVPKDVSIDIVAIHNVTSYTPFGQPEKTPPIIVRHVESFQEWQDAGIEPVRELGPE